MASKEGLWGYSPWEWRAAAILGALFLVGIVFWGASEEKVDTQMPAAHSIGSSNVTGAWAHMQGYAMRSLKAPSTAKFPFGGHRDVTALGEGRYLVESYVDSQNSFGATVRTSFRGVIRETESGWRVETFSFLE